MFCDDCGMALRCRCTEESCGRHRLYCSRGDVSGAGTPTQDWCSAAARARKHTDRLHVTSGQRIASDRVHFWQTPRFRHSGNMGIAVTGLSTLCTVPVVHVQKMACTDFLRTGAYCQCDARWSRIICMKFVSFRQYGDCSYRIIDADVCTVPVVHVQKMACTDFLRTGAYCPFRL